MRDLIAAFVAIVLLFTAASLGTALHVYRRRRRLAHRAALADGSRVVAELPTGDHLTLFTEDGARFGYGEHAIDKAAITAVRVLINGAPIAAYVSRRSPDAPVATPPQFDDRPDGIAHDRWDVAIEATTGTTLVACGALRERISQELARNIFDAVKHELERRDQAGA